MLTARTIYLKPLILIISITLFACYPSLKKEARHPEESLAPVRFFYPTFQDDMDRESLISAIRKNLDYLNRLDPEKPFHYGSQIFTSKHVKESQEAFLSLIEKNVSPEQLNEEIRGNFLVYRATGRVGNNEVLFTGYFEPVYEARLKPDDSFRYPIYKRPYDLIV
ncbi:MAG: MltA domain-containing protein, partial [Deltaproteobacteria bacterium]|nr:MltA domain-containing protein [Deltaproteobacteria bacterium]